MIRVLIVASIRLYREGLALMLGRRDEFVIAGTWSQREPLADLHAVHPDVVLLDANTPDSQTIIREVKQQDPDVSVVALALDDAESEVLACMEAGATGYVSRDASLDDLVAAVESAARGELLCSPRIAGTLVRRVATLARAHEPAPDAHLTVREGEIVSLIAQNLSNKEIATRLGIEVATVKNHVHNLLEKLDIHRRTDVARRVRNMTGGGAVAIGSLPGTTRI